MTILDEPCKDFADIVQDVQECTDRGKGLEQLATSGLTSLLGIRNFGYMMFDVTEKAKTDAARARNAFDEKTLVLQNLLYESGYYRKEIQEARDYKSAVSKSDLELMVYEDFMQAASADFSTGLDSASEDYDHQLMLRRLEHELQSRKQARKQLSELKARRDALHTNLSQKRKALTDLQKHAAHIASATQNVRKLFSIPDASAAQGQQEMAQLLPLPLYFIFSQATAILDTLSTSVRPEVVGSKDEAEAELAGITKMSTQPARKRQKRSVSMGSASESDLYQAFPLSVKLHLADLALVVTFTYLPALGIVTAEANHKAGNELLATLFKADSGEDTPSMGNKHIGDGSFVFDSQATARPYRWAQWLAGLDFLPALPAGRLVQGSISQETLQEAVSSHCRQRRAIHILATLVKRAENSSELGQQLQELGTKHLPLEFPNRLFHQQPASFIQVWQEMPKQAWPSSITASRPGTSSASAAHKTDAATENTEEDEEGELADAELVKAEDDEGAMDIDSHPAGQGGDPQTSADAPVPLSRTDKEGSIAWGRPAPGAAFRMFKLMLKTPNHWQLDGHVQVYNSYPAVAPHVVVTAIKAAYHPSFKAGKVDRPELSEQEIVAVQKEVNRGLLAKLTEDEQSHTLAYQLAQLLVSLSHHTEGKEAALVPAVRTASQAASTATPNVVVPIAPDNKNASSVTTRSGPRQR